MEVTIFRFAVAPTIVVVCFGWVVYSGSFVLTCNSMVYKVLVTAAGVEIILGCTPYTAISAMVLPYSVFLEGGVLYLTCIPMFGLMMSA